MLNNMWNKIKEYGFYIATAIFLCIGIKLWKTPDKPGWGNIILAFTGMFILWYTYETRRLAKLTEKQIKINIKPIIVIKSIGSSLKLKNIGKSDALNISINEITRTDNNNIYQFKFSEIAECGAGGEHGSSITPYFKDKSILASGEADNIKRYLLEPSSLAQKQNYEVLIEYSDVENGRWKSISVVDKNGVRFKEVKKL